MIKRAHARPAPDRHTTAEQEKGNKSVINPINNEEEEWIEICDADGQRVSMHRIAIVCYKENTYLILGAVRENDEGEEEGGLLLIRKEETEGGAIQYTLIQDEDEVEHVVGGFVIHALLDRMAEEDEEEGLFEPASPRAEVPCLEQHGPMTFCCCGDPDYLQ